MRAIALATLHMHLYALREDGAVFVLVPRGEMSTATGKFTEDPHWVNCPAVPGTEAALEQKG